MVRVAGTVVDSMDATISSAGTEVSGETDYSSIEVGVGAVVYDEGKRKSMSELVFGQASFGSLDAIEFSGGGRYYFESKENFQPYGSIYATNTIFDSVSGSSVDLGTQLGLQLGLGWEVRTSEKMFLDVSLRYLLPLVAAEANSIPIVETEVDGISIAVGIGFEF